MNEAIKRAVKAGYEHFVIRSQMSDPYRSSVLLLDPLFWKALSKAEKWKPAICRGCGEALKVDSEGVSHQACSCFENYEEMYTWVYHWTDLIEHIASGKDIDSFFKSILK
jgi:hypothetical protein